MEDLTKIWLLFQQNDIAKKNCDSYFHNENDKVT